MPETTIVISFPNWFYGILTIGILAFVFYLGFRYFQIREICKNYSKDIPKIQRSLTRISEILLQKNMTTHDVYTISNSPIQLTNDGKKAIEESKFNLFYEKNKYELIERVKKKNPKNLADLEEACKSVMLSIEDTLPSFNLLKSFSYNKGESISHILFAGAIALRDILEKEMNIKDS